MSQSRERTVERDSYQCLCKFRRKTSAPARYTYQEAISNLGSRPGYLALEVV